MKTNKEIKVCSIEGCENKHLAKGYCNKHYASYKKYGDPHKTNRRRRSTFLEDNYKTINNENFKLCPKCNEWGNIKTDFFKNTKQKDGLTVYCRNCYNTMYNEWQRENPDKRDKLMKKHKNTTKFKETRKKWLEENKESRNKQRLYKKLHHSHDLTIKEWEDCKEYFNWSCAYCGMTEEEHKGKHNQQLHKEHAISRGENGLSNCIPACMICNATKKEKNYYEWYTPTNKIYNKDRYNKIESWLKGDYNLYLDKSKINI